MITQLDIDGNTINVSNGRSYGVRVRLYLHINPDHPIVFQHETQGDVLQLLREWMDSQNGENEHRAPMDADGLTIFLSDDRSIDAESIVLIWDESYECWATDRNGCWVIENDDTHDYPDWIEAREVFIEYVRMYAEWLTK